MRRFLFIGLVLTLTFKLAISQEYKKLTLGDLYKNNKFRIHSVQGLKWMNNSSYYTSLVQNSKTHCKDVIRYTTINGNAVDTLIHGDQLVPIDENTPISIGSYEFNEDESKVLISTEVTKIYRRSSKAINYVYDLDSKTLKILVVGDKQSYATFSPDGSKVAFIRANNIYVKDLLTDELIPVTTDGSENKIINGFADWVYEEELSLSKSFFWSPDGEKIAYLKFNESEVPTYTLQKWNGLYPENYTYKYPKAGENNSVVTIHIYDLNLKNTKKISLGDEIDMYIARMQWLPNSAAISIIQLNRLQNKLDIYHCDTHTYQTKIIYTEKSKTYINIKQVDDLYYLSNGKSLIISSEKSGYKHLYHYSIDGRHINQITKGDWEVIDFHGINEKKNLLYFTSAEISPLERHIYAIDLSGKTKKKLSDQPGSHAAKFSRDFKYYMDTFSSIEMPNSTILNSANGRKINVLVENDDLVQQAQKYGFAKTEFFKIGLKGGDSLDAYIMKPVDFDKNKVYPLLMFVYGGPGSQRVLNRWGSNLWHHYLTQQGYLVACVDNRGTGGKGRDFQHVTYKHLGKYETKDQITGAGFLGEHPFVDKDRIGIWGWSYGGYMSSLSILLGNEVFKAAISVAPVTNWRYYDTIYTERYLQRPQDNPAGYDAYSPITHADKLKGALLVIHGTGDDNVHFQNSIEFQKALIKANKQFESFYYPDKDHSINGGNTRLHLYTMMTNFILENL